MKSYIEADTYAISYEHGRMPGLWGHAAAGAYIIDQFHSIGLEPYSGDRYAIRYTAQPQRWGRWPGGTLQMKNLVGVIPGHDRTLPPIVIGAHFDSAIPGPSADDNATSVAAMLYAAEHLVIDPLRRDVIVCAFDGEEPPFFHSPGMGSTRFVEDQMHAAPHLAIIMDLIGHPAPIPGVDPHLTCITGIESHPGLAGIIDGTSLPLLATRNSRVGDMSDHHAFRLHGHAFLFLSSGEWADYHTYEDTPDKIDYDKVEAVAIELLRLTVEADGRTLGPIQAYDIADLEMGTALAHLGEEMVAGLGGKPEKIVPTLRAMMQDTRIMC